MIRLTNDKLSRILHTFLYERMLTFCNQYCPERPGEPIVQGWLNRLFAGDPLLHILVVLENTYTIVNHAVIDVIGEEHSRVVICHQTQHDKPSLSSLDEGMEYIEKLAAQVQACSIVFFLTEHSKAFQKRYGYTIARTMMVKNVG